jgi:transcriptional regulator with XRE-family HTH domain
MYARYERGANELPIRHLITLCRFYNVSADYFLDTEPDQRRRKGHH